MTQSSFFNPAVISRRAAVVLAARFHLMALDLVVRVDDEEVGPALVGRQGRASVTSSARCGGPIGTRTRTNSPGVERAIGVGQDAADVEACPCSDRLGLLT